MVETDGSVAQVEKLEPGQTVELIGHKARAWCRVEKVKKGGVSGEAT